MIKNDPKRSKGGWGFGPAGWPGAKEIIGKDGNLQRAECPTCITVGNFCQEIKCVIIETYFVPPEATLGIGDCPRNDFFNVNH